MSKVTLKEIAQSLGVSPSLVSGVLNNRPGVWASEETRQRILHEAIVRGYRPHSVARALRSGKTSNVLLVYEPLPGVIPIDAFATYLSTQGYWLQSAVFTEVAQAKQILYTASASHTCDAIILWADERTVEPLQDTLSSLSVPVVLKGRYERSHPEWYQVDFDHERMMATAVEHLRSIGHRRIGYVGYPLDREFAQALLRGYLEAMHSLIGGQVPEVYYQQPASEIEEAEEIVEQWFSLPEGSRPTACVIGAGNNAWYGIERALLKRGLFIGEGKGDFAICGQSFEGLVLSFGHGYAFQEMGLQKVAEVMVNRLLFPLLSSQKPSENIIRILPPLGMVPTHGYRRFLHRGRGE
ncbi:MAG: LacI family DNA-binding transcriptional regulator [Armatimonadota bacterium]|nr:LacI family DNA-binding transcriptional regulator [Armatimonadota bacterium]